MRVKLVSLENTKIGLLVKVSWNYYLIVINVFLSFQNDYKDENENFGNVCLYVDILEILRKKMYYERIWKCLEMKEFQKESVLKNLDLMVNR